jgi:hypothetical protein
VFDCVDSIDASVRGTRICERFLAQKNVNNPQRRIGPARDQGRLDRQAPNDALADILSHSFIALKSLGFPVNVSSRPADETNPSRHETIFRF